MANYGDFNVEGALAHAGGGGTSPYTWHDIVGESTRGMSKVAGAEALGALMNAQQNPAFAQQIARMAAAGRPVMHQQPLVKARAWTIGLPSTYIGVKASVTISVAPQCFFRAEKLIASDNCTLLGGAGFGTSISAINVGQKNQLPVGAGSGGAIPTFAHLPTVLGNGVEWDTCQPAMTISLQVNDLGITPGGSTWSGAVFGKAVIA